MRYHLTLVRMATIKKSTNSKCGRGYAEKGFLLTVLVGMYVDTATMENSMEILSKTKNRVTVWLSNPTSGHISREKP